MWQSVVSSEDRSFFHHPGLDVKGLARAVLFAGRRGGGSTITQQLVKNLFVSDSKTISRSVTVNLCPLCNWQQRKPASCAQCIPHLLS